MRGKGALQKLADFYGGITPAYAGKSKIIKSVAICIGDHPRLCGEKFTDPPLALAGQGSPPPMRGKENRLISVLSEFGITPAYAGKRAYFAVEVSSVRDHPRLCGEKLSMMYFPSES